jgi:SAM-dependent methyltransferase
MNWKLKGLGQSALSLLPGATQLNYWGQKFITRAHTDYQPVVESRLEKARWIKQQFAQHGEGDIGRAQFYEFGAGWNLAGPLALYSLGINRQIVIDITPCARLELINRVIDELDRYTGKVPRRPGAPMRSLRQLESRLGITYRAPVDAYHTGIPAGSVDCITNTFTLEHIPPADVRALLRECRRILKPGGVLLSMIDYQDHYSYRDTRISIYNFLRYSERQWKWFNSALHYQNRLRHCQYRQMFADAGFEMIAEETQGPSPEDIESLKSMRLSSEFSQFSFDDLTARGSQMVSRRPAGLAQPGTRRERADSERTGLGMGAAANGAVAH